jgi:hypothetical protein
MDEHDNIITFLDFSDSFSADVEQIGSREEPDLPPSTHDLALAMTVRQID